MIKSLTQSRLVMAILLLISMDTAGLAQSLGTTDRMGVPQGQVVFVIGNVINARGIAFREELSVMRAIAMAGGVRKVNDLVSIRIHRKLAPRRYMTAAVNLKAIIKGIVAAPLLQPGDIVEVSNGQGHFLLPDSFGSPPPLWDPPLIRRKEDICS